MKRKANGGRRRTLRARFMSIMDDMGYSDCYNQDEGGEPIPDNATPEWFKGELEYFIERANETGEPLWEDVFGDNRVPCCRAAYNRAVRMVREIKNIRNAKGVNA